MRSEAAFIATVLMVAGVAAGQNRLDKPLDKNQQVGSGGLNPARTDFSQELQFRNAIVTGNAPGGFSFRGDVGYRAPGEFFGSLGSNESFSFRRDSFYSGLGGVGIRGTDALQYQFAMSTGNTPPPGLSGSGVFYRSGTDFAPTSIQNRQAASSTLEPIGRAPIDPTAPGADARGLSLMSIRSPASYMASRGLEPVTLTRTQNAEGAMVGLTASPLRGLSYDTVAPPPSGTRSEEAPTREGDGVSRADSKVDTKIASDQPERRNAYDDLMDRIRGGAPKSEDAAKAADANMPQWQRDLEELRAQLGKPAADKRAGTKTADAAKSGGETKPDEKDKPSKELRPETVKRLRDAAGEVERLAPDGYDAYAVHMQAGQEHIAAGRFFNAEERFASALGVKSGDPMAAIGRVHAQLGASMFLSASVNLRALFTEHPEVIGLKYKPELLPSRERIGSLIVRLGEMAKATDDRGRDSGMLLAYLGYQSGNADALKRGLEAMASADGGGAAPPEATRQLAALLTKLWAPPEAKDEAGK